MKFFASLKKLKNMITLCLNNMGFDFSKLKKEKQHESNFASSKNSKSINLIFASLQKLKKMYSILCEPQQAQKARNVFLKAYKNSKNVKMIFCKPKEIQKIWI